MIFFICRLRAPTPYGATGAPWPMKTDSFYDRERREHEEREKREREERERREREDRERREREERERREREERERKEREERERERERRAEHEKERARSLESSQDRGIRRDASRSPLRQDIKDVNPLTGVPHPSIVHPVAAGMASLPHNQALKSEPGKTDSRPSSRPGSRPGSRPTDTRVKTEMKDDVVIVGSKEAPPRHHPHMQLPPTHPSVGPSSSHHLLPPHSLAVTVSSPLDRARYLGVSGGGYPPGAHPQASHWSDPLMRDPYRTAVAQESLARHHEQVMRESMLHREAAMADPLRSLDRSREDALLRSNPLGPLILTERYREQQTRDIMIERERAAAVAGLSGGLYPPHSSMLPPHGPHLGASLLPPGIKSGPPMPHHTQPGGPAGFHPQSIGAMHPGPPGHHSLVPGLPPPLISSMRGSPSSLLRPPDKKDGPR